MKILKDIDAEQISIIAYVLTIPPYGRQTLAPAMAADRDPIFKKIIEGAEPLGEGNYRFPKDKKRDIILKNSEWNTLKEAFKSAHFPSMGHKIEADPLEELIKEAPDYKDK